MTLHSRNRRGAASLRSVTEITPKSRFLRANGSPIQYGFRAGAHSIPYSVNILNLILFLSHAHKLKFGVYLPIYCDRPFFRLSFVYTLRPVFSISSQFCCPIDRFSFPCNCSWPTFYEKGEIVVRKEKYVNSQIGSGFPPKF